MNFFIFRCFLNPNNPNRFVRFFEWYFRLYLLRESFDHRNSAELQYVVPAGGLDVVFNQQTPRLGLNLIGYGITPWAKMTPPKIMLGSHSCGGTIPVVGANFSKANEKMGKEGAQSRQWACHNGSTFPLVCWFYLDRVAEASDTRRVGAIPRSLAGGRDKSRDPPHGTKISLILMGASGSRIRD